MPYSQPKGYRLSSEVKITAVSRALERFGWAIWRAETVRAVASVAVELLAAPDRRNHTYQTLSNNQITEDDLVMSQARDHGLLMRAAEFIDVGHALMHRVSALPLPPQLDLRCRAQFMDDQVDPFRRWTYVLFGTESERLEQLFLQLRGMESFPLNDPGELPTATADEPDAELRGIIWDRVLAPYARYSPLSISAPDPQTAFDIAESVRQPDRDPEYHAQGNLTVTALVAEVARQLGPDAPDDLRQQLLAPIRQGSVTSDRHDSTKSEDQRPS